MTVRIGIIGAAGQMGQALAEAIAQEPKAELSGGVGRPGSDSIEKPLAPGLSLLISDDAKALAQASDVLIDFSSPSALPATLALGRPIVVGTTGLEPPHHALLDEAAKKLPVLQSANMSLGVNLLAALVEQTAAALGDDWDIEILEMHHRHKIDAPSGTALLLGEAAAKGRNITLTERSVKSRDGIGGPRKTGDIGFACLRGGSVPGDHHVIFATQDERLELSHSAQSRIIFARGALKAALWLINQPAGRYTMRDALGL